MLFNSFEFIFVFLPMVFIGYFLLSHKTNYNVAKVWIIVTSLLFYSWWNILYLPLLLGSIIFNFYVSRYLAIKKRSKFVLGIGVTGNVLLLSYFKYMDFLISNVNFLFNTTYETMQIVLPLAISFYTFQQIAYLVDSYRNETREYSFLDYMLFITFFPQLIAGPIVYHKQMMSQFMDEKNAMFNMRNIAMGIFIFVIGLFKKVVIADTFAGWANTGFDNSLTLTFAEGWITSLSYTMQLYFDFSGYSDMAIGLALLFNIKLPINFDSPYKSLSIQEFWRRWHITLNRFLTKYIYIPLGGSRKGVIFTYINILIIFAISGIWHGAGWTFVVWGLLHGFATCINRLWSKAGFRFPKVIAWFITFNFVNIAWIFFRATSITQAFEVLSSMFNIQQLLTISSFSQQVEKYNVKLEIMGYTIMQSIITVIVLLTSFFVVLFAKNTNELSRGNFNTGLWACYLSILIAIIVHITFSNFTNSEFIYFNF